jgi:hypothetical protein
MISYDYDLVVAVVARSTDPDQLHSSCDRLWPNLRLSYGFGVLYLLIAFAVNNYESWFIYIYSKFALIYLLNLYLDFNRSVCHY